MSALAAFSVLYSLLSVTNSQFLEQPDAGTVFAPVQDQVTLTCSVEERYHIDWHVNFASGEVVYASSLITRSLFLRRQFTLEGVTTSRSTLSLWETENQTNNGTNITCIAQDTGVHSLQIPGNTVQVIFYGPPLPPTDVKIAENELGSLNISWSLKFIEGVPVNYTLTVLNLNTTSAQPIIIAGLLDQSYVFETSRLCDVYSFTVTAVTAAGNSTPSLELIFTRDDHDKVSSAQPTIMLTTSNLPITGGNSTVTIVITVCAAFLVLIVSLVLANVLLCVFCHKKTNSMNKTEITDPVYETPDMPVASSSPFVISASSAYGASANLQNPSDKFCKISPSSSSADEFCKNPDSGSSKLSFAMMSSSAYEATVNPRKELPSTACESTTNMNTIKENSTLV